MEKTKVMSKFKFARAGADGQYMLKWKRILRFRVDMSKAWLAQLVEVIWQP